MKKLIVIFMVTAAASMATAGVEWHTSVALDTKTISVALYGTDILQFILSDDGPAVAFHSHNPGTYSNITINPGFSFPMGTNAGTVHDGAIWLVYGLVDLGDPPVTGELWSFDYTLDEASTGYVCLDIVAPGGVAKDSTGVTHQIPTTLYDLLVPPPPCPDVPEPMSIALLALGGLMLRRKRKE